MKKIFREKLTKQILTALLVFIMCFATIQPIANAGNGGGALFEPIAQFLAFIADLGIELLQDFLWNGININEGLDCQIYIGPATIFTGKIARVRC